MREIDFHVEAYHRSNPSANDFSHDYGWFVDANRSIKWAMCGWHAKTFQMDQAVNARQSGAMMTWSDLSASTTY